MRTLRFAQRDGVAQVTLDRPEVLNSINREMVRDFHDMAARVENDGSVRCLVITGEGRAFSAGGDLGDAAGADAASHAALLGSAIGDALRRIELLPIPVIAAVNGLAAAGGLELLLCCDIVLAARTARFADTHAKWGLLPGAGGAIRLAKKIGIPRATMMMLSGRWFDAGALRDWGLVAEVVEDADLTATASALAADLCRASPLSLRHLKTLLASANSADIDRQLEIGRVLLNEHATSTDMREGLAAFVAKREPAFLDK